jgi:multicomponent Na+:H+ antiporter subunit A
LIAITQKDAKRILAYSTISVLGLLTMLLGIGTPAAVSAAITYFVAHSLYKGALFMIAGILDHETGTRDVTQIRGIARKMPKTTIAAILAGLSGASVFPFLGFSAKELVVASIWTSPWLLATTALTSILLVVVSLSVAYRPFFGGAPIAPKIPHEAPAGLWIGPLLLAILGFFFGLTPHSLEKPYQAAVATVLGHKASFVLHSWPEFTPLFGLSFATWVIGLGLYSVLFHHEKLVGRLGKLVDRWGFARMYDAGLAGLLRFASWQTRHLQTGHLRHYLLITVATTIIVVGWPLCRSGPFPAVVTDIQLPEFVLIFVVLAAVVLILCTLSRLTVVAALGAIGISILVLYVIFSAVDLALTQVLVEALTVVIFVLVLHHLPRFVNRSPVHVLVPDAIISILFGATVTLLILMSSTLFPDPVLSRYFVTHGLPEAHGRNIVNVILVDFRAMDTLGETTVLCVAGIGVHALLQAKMRNGA